MCIAPLEKEEANVKEYIFPEAINSKSSEFSIEIQEPVTLEELVLIKDEEIYTPIQIVAVAPTATPIPPTPTPEPYIPPTTAISENTNSSTTSSVQNQSSSSSSTSVSVGEHLTSIRACESGHDYKAINQAGPFYGAYQFLQSTWNTAVAGAGYPEWVGRLPSEAPPHVQDAAAVWLYNNSGSGQWPICQYQ